MSKVTYKPNPKVYDIFETLESYLEFCKDYGYVYDEADLHNYKSYAWQQFQKFVAGKHARDQWIDAIRGNTYHNRSYERKPARQ